jgi:uncharacterized protein (DUF1786 family)
MSRYLLLDIGAGTLDVMYYDDVSLLQYKAVVKSPVPLLAEQVSSTSGNLLVTGCEMGGGAISAAIKERAETDDVVITASAAATLHHDLDRVRSWNIRVIEDQEVAKFRNCGDFNEIRLCDIDADRIRQIVTGFGVPFEFDVVAVCAQDHGVAPKGVSHLDYRHNLFRDLLGGNPYPHALIYSREEIPKAFNRLSAIAYSAGELNAGEIYVMDSGMAAILGASLDKTAISRNHILVLDIATSHTVAASMVAGELYGFFEYHTHDITLERLEDLLVRLANGKLDHAQVLAEGGHGAYIRKHFGFDRVEAIIATGPKRWLAADSRLPLIWGAPFGDNMMTGTTGLLAAVLHKKGSELNFPD